MTMLWSIPKTYIKRRRIKETNCKVQSIIVSALAWGVAAAICDWD
jgi:hypothetical protein